ncbi:MAG: nucleotide sugar dehydrogenase [Prosthecobacter sp.]|uniref:nucleotide sugar dehydrogenase n=1 Tax=Prosthecobacter sp. TaxID=1965333 RepID=UPI0025D93C0C|nr:nucleotide sugar dehydrogenase [Prosthecobacter sp.]MCF7787311.1 nucleotide sugar dehydrogenase [Prosthecobacter sp.]
MNISVFGLGYVGAVTAACLAQKGHLIIGVDLHAAKVAAFNQGISPIVEPDLDALLKSGSESGQITATQDAAEAVAQSDASIICVGTPSLPSGKLNLDFVHKVTAQIVEAIKESKKTHILLYRSTMLPGSTRAIVTDMLADLVASGQVRVYYCPEFLREGTAVRDFHEPSLVVIGTHDGTAPVDAAVCEIMGGQPSILAWEGAEMIKYSCNYFHALKVGFANEIGRLCKHLGEDGTRVMDVLCADTRLNISRYYMKPGNPFGGSCLPKDVSALKSFARQENLSLPLLENTAATNAAHQDLFVSLIEGKAKRRIGFLGLAFKANTDDLRGSPMVAAAETLIGRGHELSIYDPHINLSRLIGANEQQIQARMPHLAQLLKQDARDVIQSSEVIVVSQKCVPFETLKELARPDQVVIDVQGWRELSTLSWQYEGICW